MISKNRSQGRKQILTVLVHLVFILLFVGCGVTRPSVENINFASVGYKHTGNELNCNSCHNSERPTNVLGFLSLVSATPFDYTTHGGLTDCQGCHLVKTIQRSRVDWAGGYYPHVTSKPTTCSVCHESERPKTYGNNVSHVSSGDCYGCHQSSMKTSFSSMNDWTGGVGMPHGSSGPTNTSSTSGLDCNSCHGQAGWATHKLSVPASSHYFQATTCIGCHNDFSSFSSALKFSHGANATTCENCHNFNSGAYTSFTRVSLFNVSNSFTLASSVPVAASHDGTGFNLPHSDSHFTNCASCHGYTAPAPGANVWQWRHDPNGGSSRANGCNLCHN